VVVGYSYQRGSSCHGCDCCDKDDAIEKGNAMKTTTIEISADKEEDAMECVEEGAKR